MDSCLRRNDNINYFISNERFKFYQIYKTVDNLIIIFVTNITKWQIKVPDRFQQEKE